MLRGINFGSKNLQQDLSPKSLEGSLTWHLQKWDKSSLTEIDSIKDYVFQLRQGLPRGIWLFLKHSDFKCHTVDTLANVEWNVYIKELEPNHLGPAIWLKPKLKADINNEFGVRAISWTPALAITSQPPRLFFRCFPTKWIKDYTVRYL